MTATTRRSASWRGATLLALAGAAALAPPPARVADVPRGRAHATPRAVILASSSLRAPADSSAERVRGGDDECGLNIATSWEKFARRPGARFRAILRTSIRVGFSVARARRLDPSSPAAAARRRETAERVVSQVLRLGPTFIKLGQVASCRPDLLAPEYIDALKRLQDDVPAVPYEGVRSVLECELGRPVREIFRSFERTPIAAASLGQVHRATLLDGTPVVVKVQRPLLRELYDTDLANIRRIARAADGLGRLRGTEDRTKWRDFYSEARQLLLREIDYAQEAANQREFAAQFSREAWVKVPAVLANLTSARVLVQEEVSGVKVTSVRKLEATPGLEPRLIAERLARAYLLQFCRDGFFHTDPHPGNLAVDTAVPGGRLIFYDFGQCSRCAAERAGILSVIKAIVASDAQACVRAFDELGIVAPGADRVKLERTIADNFASGRIGAGAARQADGAPKRAARATSGAGGGGGAGADADFLQLSSVYTFIFRVLAQLGGVGRSLDPEFDFISAVAPHVAELDGPGFLLAKQLERVGWRPQDLRALVQQPRTVDLIATKLSQWESGQAPLRVRAIEAEGRLERLEAEQASQGRLLLAIAALQLAVLTSARASRVLAALACARWLLGAIGRRRR